MTTNQIIYIVTLAFGLVNCNSGISKKVDLRSSDFLHITSVDQKQPNIFIKNKSQYSQTFIKELNNSSFNEPIKLIDNLIIVGVDTTEFPDDLAMNKATIFKAIEDSKCYDLTLTRLNHTTINFIFQLTDKDKNLLHSEEGEATLNALFFLASEGDEDKENGEGYLSYEYWKKDKNCWLSIRVGIGKDDKGKQRAKITFDCEDKNKKTLSLDECPTLRTD